MKVRNSYLASLERLLLISPNGLERLLQSFKVSRIRDACFTASLFQGFITHNSSSNLGEQFRWGKRIMKIRFANNS